MRSTVILIRHCQSSGQAPDAPLTAQGAAAARALADRLLQLGIDAVYSSPYLRAVQTIEPFAAKRALPINIELDLRERQLSAEPLDDWLDHIRQSFANFDHRAPGGETLREAQRRGLATLQRIHAERPACAAVTSHGNLLASLLHHMDPSFGFEAWQAMPNPALYRVTLTASAPTSFELLA